MENLGNTPKTTAQIWIPRIFGIIGGILALPLAGRWIVSFYEWGTHWAPRRGPPETPPFFVLAYLYGEPVTGWQEFIKFVLVVVSFPIGIIIFLFAWFFILALVCGVAGGAATLIGSLVTNPYPTLERIYYFFVPHPAANIIKDATRGRSSVPVNGKALVASLKEPFSLLETRNRRRHAEKLARRVKSERERLEKEEDLMRGVEAMERQRARVEELRKARENAGR